MNTDDIELRQTCGACPEQYDAFYRGIRVGYLRLRHGHFRVDYPSCNVKVIYSAQPQGDGCFETDERDGYLLTAKLKIVEELTK